MPHKLDILKRRNLMSDSDYYHEHMEAELHMEPELREKSSSEIPLRINMRRANHFIPDDD